MARTWGASLAALVAALLPAAAGAADADRPVEELVVTGTRAPEGVDPDKIGSSVTVITPQDFEDRQVRIVSDVLRDVPGFAVSRTGALGGQTQVRVRGTEGNHVLTLIDGIEADDPFLGEFDYATLLADDVARIEILRGPQSALYGSDPIGGVINYITPTAADDPGGQLRIEGGSEKTLGVAGRYAAVAGPVDYVLSGASQTTDGYVGQTLPGGARRLGSKLSSAAAKVGWQVSEQLQVRAVVRVTDTHAQINSSSFGRGQVDSPGSYFDATSFYGFLGADLSLLDGRWTHSLSVQGVSSDRDGFNARGRASGDQGVRRKGSYATTYKLETGDLTHRFTGAVDFEKETYENTSPASSGADLTRRSIRNTGFVGQYDLEIGDNAGVGAAVRYDDNEFFKNATTYKVQGFYRLNEMVRFRAAAGSGIKNPSQTELFGFNATGPFPFRGNPDLKPEKAHGWEAGADLTFLDGRVTLGATYFDQKLKDEIFTYFGGPGLPAACPTPPLGTSTTCNRTFESTQKGEELFGTAKLTDQLEISGAYTHLRARENGLEEIRRAPNIASANLTWRPLEGRATINLNVRYNGRQLDSNFSGINPPFPAGLSNVKAATGANAGKVVLASFTLVNLAVSYDLNDHLQVFGRVENLGDEDYYEVFGFPAQPRAAYGGVRVKF
jgi:vitamin B12 transporter